MGQVIKKLAISFLTLASCLGFMTESVIASQTFHQSTNFFGPAFISEIAIWLGGLLFILVLTYFYFQSHVSRAIIFLISTASISLGVTTIFERYDFNNYTNQQFIQVMQKTANIRSSLENQIQTALTLSKVIPIYMKSRDFQYTKEEINPLISNIIEAAPAISHFALAENLIINHVYPSKGNQKAIGLNYQENAAQWPSVERAITSNNTLLAGPVDLVQGGQALIGRIPVFYSFHSAKNVNSLWGIISIVIKMEPLFQAAGLYDENNLKLAIRGTDAKGSEGEAFLGEAELFSEKAVIQEIKLPVGSWEIAALPTAGWPKESPSKWSIRLVVFAFFLIVALAIIFRANHHFKQQKITRQLRREIEERKILKIEQEELNKKLSHSQRLKDIGQLTSGIAHDFNNILTAISGYAQLAQTNLSMGTKPEVSERYLSEVLKAGDRARDLIKQLMAFSRGKDIKAQLISPYIVTKETISMMQATIPSSIEITSRYYDKDSIIESDPVQLQQVVMNLIVNSRDSLQAEQGKIEISIEKVIQRNQVCASCSETFSGEYLQICVADNGMGIPLEAIEHIFEPFFSTKKRSDGSGMGLSVVHGITHSASGHILLETTVNKGTSIKLLFPVRMGTVDETTGDSEEEIITKPISGHVLIVDDEKSITSLFSNLVSEMGLEYSAFSNPIDALEYYHQHSDEITLILTDETMPSMKGSEMVKKIRETNSTVPIIICSGYNETLQDMKQQDLGINDYCSKPVNLERLSRKIYKHHC